MKMTRTPTIFHYTSLGAHITTAYWRGVCLEKLDGRLHGYTALPYVCRSSYVVSCVTVL